MTLSRSLLAAIATAGIMALATAFPTFAAPTTVVVTPSNPQGWVVSPDTTSGGEVNFVADSTSPAPPSALQLKTNSTSASKAAYGRMSGDLLSSVNALSYWTKQNSATFIAGDASYQLVTFLNGNAGGYTTLVFEPYLNPGAGSVIPTVWQKWDVYAGQFWSTHGVTCSAGTVNARPMLYTLAQIKAKCPAALVAAYGVDVGSGNPSWDIATDLFQYNDTVYNFEVDGSVPPPVNGCPPDCSGLPPSGATPELDSLLLFGSGLSGLGGYAIMRLRARRRTGD
jgi:hypothetical protein